MLARAMLARMRVRTSASWLPEFWSYEGVSPPRRFEPPGGVGAPGDPAVWKSGMSMKPLVSAWAALLVSLGIGCAGNLNLKLINSEQRKPNNVWVFFTAQKGEEPVAGLGAEHFKIYEDAALVSPYESKQVIQN